MSTSDLLTLPGLVTDIGFFKCSQQFIISTPLMFERIKAFYDGLLPLGSYEYDDTRIYSKGPHASFLIYGPRASLKYRWQIDVLRADDDEAVDDVTSYLVISDRFSSCITPGNKYFVVVFDNDSALAEKNEK